jgi:hypothetical protein
LRLFKPESNFDRMHKECNFALCKDHRELSKKNLGRSREENVFEGGERRARPPGSDSEGRQQGLVSKSVQTGCQWELAVRTPGCSTGKDGRGDPVTN